MATVTLVGSAAVTEPVHAHEEENGNNNDNNVPSAQERKRLAQEERERRGARGWWAPCMWCALGVATLVGGAVTIHARLGGEAEPIALSVIDSHPQRDDVWVHFPLPPQQAWDNVHHFCAMLLPFLDEAAIDAWSARHGLPRGTAVPLDQAAALARLWYDRHADPDYVKWTPTEAQQIFTTVGLTGPFWTLDTTGERF